MDYEIIKGTFYEQELVKCENESYEIDKIIRKENNKLLVKWINKSWINKSDIMKCNII